jgi:hypothetical protein
MGNTENILKREKAILRHPQSGEASEFYWACRSGSIDRVKELLDTISYNDSNRLEPNGSTPLHAASYYGHTEIVQLLLHQRGCQRHRLNLYGLTAYEETQNEKVRQLFHRPGQVNRFCEANEEDNIITNIFKVTTREEAEQEDNEYETFLADKWLNGHGSSKEIEAAMKDLSGAKTMTQSSLVMTLGKIVSKDMRDTKLMKDINEFIVNHVTAKHPQYQNCVALVEKAFKTQRPEHLLKLYTLETPFYRALADNDCDDAFNTFQMIVLMQSNKLEARFFQGVSYRGVKMTDNDLRAYRWALKSGGVIETQTFCSTSLDRKVAERFAGVSTPDKQSVLLIFNFPEKCDTAINLGKMSPSLPCISEYENETEVLLTSKTLFTVKQIETSPDYLLVYLENILAKRMSMLDALKILYNEYKQNREEGGMYYKGK